MMLYNSPMSDSIFVKNEKHNEQKHSRDHVGIPKFIELGFAKNEQAFCFNFRNHQIYEINVKKLGVEKDYYTEDVEKDILANGIEKDFSEFYRKYIKTDVPFDKSNLIIANQKVIVNFFSFMFMRSKENKNFININSKASPLFGDLSHSELLKTNNELRIDCFKLLGDKYSLHPLINLSAMNFINNSVGWSLCTREGEVSILVLLDTKNAILASAQHNNDFEPIYIFENQEKMVLETNKWTRLTERTAGNGFIFGKEKNDIALAVGE